MMERLTEAARLAADLSESRRKAITLTLRPEGVHVEGVYRDVMLAPAYRYTGVVTWPDLDTGADYLQRMIRDFDRSLTGHWRDEGMPGDGA